MRDLTFEAVASSQLRRVVDGILDVYGAAFSAPPYDRISSDHLRCSFVALMLPAIRQAAAGDVAASPRWKAPPSPRRPTATRRYVRSWTVSRHCAWSPAIGTARCAARRLLSAIEEARFAGEVRTPDEALHLAVRLHEEV